MSSAISRAGNPAGQVVTCSQVSVRDRDRDRVRVRVRVRARVRVKVRVRVTHHSAIWDYICGLLV